MDQSTSDYDREKLQERLAKLSGGVAVLKVGLGDVRAAGPEGGRANRPGQHSKSATEQQRSKEDTEDCCPPVRLVHFVRHIGSETAAQLPHILHPSNLPLFACRHAQVGGASEVEVGEKKDRITDALNATKVG